MLLVIAACCPVNCVASWVTTGNCTGACSGGAGLLPERYIITGVKGTVLHTHQCMISALGWFSGTAWVLKLGTLQIIVQAMCHAWDEKATDTT